MNEFVVGQKIVCVDNSDFLKSLSINKIYTVVGIGTDVVEIITNKGKKHQYFNTRFKTIIQSDKDVIPEMTLTLKDFTRFGSGDFKEKGTKVTIQDVDDFGIKCTENYIYGIEEFQEYKPKEDNEESNMKNDYEVVKPFNIYDIYEKGDKNCNEFQIKFGELLKEQIDKELSNYDFEDTEDIMYSKILLKNLPYLEEIGFIKEKKRDIELKSGMILKKNELAYKIVSCGQYYFKLEYMLYIEDKNFMYDYGRKFEAETLNELNEITGEDFEVINEG